MNDKNRTYKKAYSLYFNKNKTLREVHSELKNSKYPISLKNVKKLLKVDGKGAKNKIYTDNEIRLILYMYKKHVGKVDNIIDYFNEKYKKNLTKNYLYDLAFKFDVKKENIDSYNVKKVNFNDEKEIIKKYKNKQSTVKLAEEYGYKTTKSIIDILKKHDIKIRECHEHMLDNVTYRDFSLEFIDSNFKAYFLGLLLTDGYVKTTNSKKIELSLIDEDCIAFIANELNATYKAIKRKNSNCKIIYRINLFGENLIINGERLGFVGNKTYATEGPILLKEELVYLPYILRGIIDGDGWIRKDGKEFFICSASIKFIKKIQSFLEHLGMIDLKINHIENEYNGIYVIRSGIKHNIKILKEDIYDIPFGMQRKYNRLKKDVQRT